MEKTAEELQKEIEELHRKQWEITERLRDPRGLRRNAGGTAINGNSRIFGQRPRGFVRPADGLNSEDQPAPKRRLLSAVVKMAEGGEIEGEDNGMKDVKDQGLILKDKIVDGGEKDNMINTQQDGLNQNHNWRTSRMNFDVQTMEPVPRVLPKDEDPALVKRNKRMLRQLLGTLEKFRDEDKALSTSQAYLSRSDSLQRAEQRAREESERLRQKEREEIAEKRRRDLTLRARVAAKAEEKKLDLLFIRWTEHHKILSNFLRTKAEPPIFYLPKKPLDVDPTLAEKKDKIFQEWKSVRREELSEYQKQIEKQALDNVETELERWQNTRNSRKANNLANLQETMDIELETHRLEHGPKPRKIPGGNVEEEDVEDIAGEDDLIDDVLVVDDSRRVDDVLQTEPVKTIPNNVDSTK